MCESGFLRAELNQSAVKLKYARGLFSEDNKSLFYIIHFNIN